ncbi:glycogen debranching enzyme-like [Lytechinus variegatus]|uniref:glycogen debranching enzyme-like n=1 Tax=Lytechinus variegatus TaxID=7654 RepID=UPI001BB2478F|nr:glycogen debranching enzyme-like [Lytechinus variegatus]
MSSLWISAHGRLDLSIRGSTIIMASQVRKMTLNEGEHKNTTLYRLKKGWTLHFQLGPSLQARNVSVFTNHPPQGKTFNRKEFYELGWEMASQSQCDTSERYCKVELGLAGAFQYYFTIDNSTKEEGSGFFLVDPVLTVAAETDILPLDCITAQTVLTKSLGPFSSWEDRLRVSHESGYNVIHFTPIQELGASNSSYSIRNQHAINPSLDCNGNKVTLADVQGLVSKMQHEWGVLSICDVVWNHSSFDSPWLKEHPECAYNVQNSPHLRPAFVVDRIFAHFNSEVMEGKWEAVGIPKIIDNEEQLHKIRHILTHEVFPPFKLQEFYQLDVEKTLEEFRERCKGSKEATPQKESKPWEVSIIQDKKYRRLASTIDMNKALDNFNIQRNGVDEPEARIEQCCQDLRSHLERLNGLASNVMGEDIRNAIENLISNVRYHHLEPSGPKLVEVTKKNPLVNEYFRHPGPATNVRTEEALMDSPQAPHLMASNGWVMGDDPLKNFAEAGSKVYLRRELLNWGDSIKLRYGKSPEDCPFLWQHMLEYTKNVVSVFHGVRIDNCHSTPIHVAEYFLDEGRKIRPDLYVMAELFTASEHIDNMFINRLGISSLIREAMSAYDSHEEGRLVYRYGGEPVGSFLQPAVRPLEPSIAHALFMDVTHDNPSPVQVRSVYDLLPSAALVSMASCAIGSTRGYDELVYEQIHVVNEKRFYTSWNENPKDSSEVNFENGIIAAKRALNELHQTLGDQGYTQVYVDQVDENIVAVTRHCPISHLSVILVARTAFKHPHNAKYTGHIPPLCIPGSVEEIILEARLVEQERESAPSSSTHITGLSNYGVQMQTHVTLLNSEVCELLQHGSQAQASLQEIDFINFPPGSVIAFKVVPHPSARAALSSLRSCIAQFGYRVRTLSGSSPMASNNSSFHTLAQKLSLTDMNHVLYRCDNEERDDGKGSATYDIPNFGKLVYCGLQGFMSLLVDIRSKNDLGHPMCENLRQGDWMPGYVANRLKLNPATKQLGLWFEKAFTPLTQIPRYLIPCYFDAIMVGAYTVILDLAWKKMSSFVLDGSSFVRSLALGSVQMCGIVKTSPLPVMSPSLEGVPTGLDEETGKYVQRASTMSAGLPHFSSGFMRCWGRDTFIALPGLLLVTGRADEAKHLILAFAGTLRHGLIPNLLGGGDHARFNCRDAVWFWLYCIQLYTKTVKDGISILEAPISRIFPSDDADPHPPGFVDQPLSEVIQEAMQRHAEGVSYRERHAGQGLDRNMTDQGFNVTHGVDHNTGFPFGGSEWNCGTWMDKVGDSELGGNRGIPATPRDGSPVEIVGLCKAAVRWLTALHKEGKFPHDGVTVRIEGKQSKLTYWEWDHKLQANFEKHFWIASDASKTANKLINRRGMYKDSVGATQFWADYQLRPNFPIAMVVAPELFTPSNAWTALSLLQKELLGPLGMKTLDPGDWAYEGVYDNAYDGPNKKTARGWNYHQGPEWVWPLGYFLRAKLHFARVLPDAPADTFESTVQSIRKTLIRHHEEIMVSPWRGLPELTNKNGAPCRDSCPTQAWSMGCLLELMSDLDQALRQ